MITILSKISAADLLFLKLWDNFQAQEIACIWLLSFSLTQILMVRREF